MDVSASSFTVKKLLLIILTLVCLGLVLMLTNTFRSLTVEDELLLDSTLGELAVWMSEQTDEEEIESYLGQFAENWASSLGQETLESEILLVAMRNGLTVYSMLIALVIFGGFISIFSKPAWLRHILLVALIGLDVLFFVIPTINGDLTLWYLIVTVFLLLVVMFLAEGHITKILGFFIVLSALFVVWESSKIVAGKFNYKITLPQSAWEYDTYDTIASALVALNAGDIDAVILDRNDARDLMAVYPSDADDVAAEDLPYPDLRYLDDLDGTETVAWLVIEPDLPGRLRVAVRAEDVEFYSSISDLSDIAIATITGEFAETNYLSVDRRLLLADLKILNDLNLPHLQSIAEALLQPARRNGALLLVRILADAGLYTLSEAVFGFAFGAILGLLLGTLFAHSTLLERSLLPYVVASQTVPILAIAPMVVIWLGASPISVAVIAAYLTFFPVTINTLRGLLSADAKAVELLETYAANRSTIFWKLRFPSALPYIFTALKVSATASVVGAIIGELPSGIGEGLGRAILNFSSDYSLISTPKLWASIVMAAFVGILFFLTVVIVERLVLGRYIRTL